MEVSLQHLSQQNCQLPPQIYMATMGHRKITKQADVRPYLSNNCSDHKPARINYTGPLSGMLLLKPVHQVEDLGCYWQTLGSKDSFANVFWKVVARLDPAA